jgi:hypothetical protein
MAEEQSVHHVLSAFVDASNADVSARINRIDTDYEYRYMH